MIENPDDIRREIEIATDAYFGARRDLRPIKAEMDERLDRFQQKYPQTPAPWYDQWEDTALPAMEAAVAAEHGRHLYHLNLRLARAEADPTNKVRSTP